MSVVNEFLSYRGRTVSDILDECKGAGRGFDLLRLGLALLVLFGHTAYLAGTKPFMIAAFNSIYNFLKAPFGAATSTSDAATSQAALPMMSPGLGLDQPITLAILPMFFALSGFLVTGSAVRTQKLLPFLSLRILRLLPALFVEVVLSAIIFGIAFTTLPLSEYFSHREFWAYFLNIIGEVHLYLPGVFTSNKYSVVNGSLWTLPWELYCYVTMSALMLSGLLYRREIFTIIYAVVTVPLIIASFFYGFDNPSGHVYGTTLVYYFCTGVLAYRWKEKIIFHEFYFIALSIICYLFMYFSPRSVYLYPLLLTYITIFIGVFPMPKIALVSSGDYSYGIYLYGHPVAQAVIAKAPLMSANILFLAPLVGLLTILFAALSWHGIEKHCLKLKRYIAPGSSKISEILHPDSTAKAS